jgi:hypothetical protein
MKRQLTVAVAATLFAAAAGAQTIYRCGSTYSQQPCAGATALEAASAPSAADTVATRRDTERQQKAADAMENARLKEESKPVAAYIPKEKVEETRTRPPEVFTARAPGEKKKKKPAKKKSD